MEQRPVLVLVVVIIVITEEVELGMSWKYE